MSLGEFVAVAAASRIATSAAARHAFFASQAVDIASAPAPDALAAAHRAPGSGDAAGASKSVAEASTYAPYAAVDLHASYATEATEQLFGPGSEEEDDPFSILNSGGAVGAVAAGSSSAKADGAGQDELEVMDFGEFVAALVRVGVWKVHGHPGVPVAAQVERVLRAVAGIQGQPRSSATLEASRRKQLTQAARSPAAAARNLFNL
jgi:hypothetical protein